MTADGPVTVKPASPAWDGDDYPEVTLTPVSGLLDRWTVALTDGTVIGEVDRYTGSLDRRIPIGGRFLRQPGKRRTLWSYTVPGERPWNDVVSRAECLRALIREHQR